VTSRTSLVMPVASKLMVDIGTVLRYGSNNGTPQYSTNVDHADRLVLRRCHRGVAPIYSGQKAKSSRQHRFVSRELPKSQREPDVMVTGPVTWHVHLHVFHDVVPISLPIVSLSCSVRITVICGL
jgi:hypothetical protein